MKNTSERYKNSWANGSSEMNKRNRVEVWDKKESERKYINKWHKKTCKTKENMQVNYTFNSILALPFHQFWYLFVPKIYICLISISHNKRYFLIDIDDVWSMKWSCWFIRNILVKNQIEKADLAGLLCDDF